MNRKKSRARAALPCVVSCLMLATGCEWGVFDDIVPGRNLPPIAAFSVGNKTALSGAREVSIPFDASASFDDSAIAYYVWDFGDGSAVQTLAGDLGRLPVHVYLASNVAVTVKLVVKDDDNASSEPVTLRLPLAVNRPPVARFIASPTLGPSPLVVVFDASSSSDPDPNETEFLQYRWSFGDGSPSVLTRAATLEHVYTRAGQFRPELVVSDGQDQSTVAHGVVNVE